MTLQLSEIQATLILTLLDDVLTGSRQYDEENTEEIAFQILDSFPALRKRYDHLVSDPHHWDVVDRGEKLLHSLGDELKGWAGLR